MKPKTSAIERVAFSIAEFCFRNSISRQKYRTLRAENRGPVEMRVGINTIRITSEAEHDWQLLMQEPQPEIEIRAVERAVKAGTAAAKSDRHISKRNHKNKLVADQQQTIRDLSAQLRKARNTKNTA